MLSFRVRSRLGNLAIGAIGAFDAVAGVVLLVREIVRTWGHATSHEYMTYAVIATAASVGVWLVLIARQNLGGHVDLHLLRRDRPRRTASAH